MGAKRCAHTGFASGFTARQHQTSKDFSISALGRVCEAEGVMKGRALYNAASADYVRLIEAWSALICLRQPCAAARNTSRVRSASLRAACAKSSPDDAYKIARDELTMTAPVVAPWLWR